MATLRLELAKEESVEAGRGELCPHETSPSAFLQIGLDLEEQQSVQALFFIQSLIFQKAFSLAIVQGQEDKEDNPSGC